MADWPNEALRSIVEDGEAIYGFRHDVSGQTLLLLCKEKIIDSLGRFESVFADSDVAYRISDDSGRFVRGFAEAKGVQRQIISKINTGARWGHV